MGDSKKISYSLSSMVIEEFDKRAKELAINKSALIELLIKEWLRANQ